jgi:hypothetical protein
MERFPRVYHPFTEWEEVKYNMWGNVSDKKAMTRWAFDFTSDYKLYGSFMFKVVDEWPISCENALTDYFLNRRAWIGHAACALANRCPEDIVRLVWGYLTDEQQFLANEEANRAIRTWEQRYRENKNLREDLGTKML